MKLLIISDAWEPQTNGVVTTYKNMHRELNELGLEVEIIHPGLFHSIPCPGYAEIRLSMNTWRMGAMIERSDADFIHLAVEGPLGLAAKRYLDKRDLRYTSSFHTRFPEYVTERFPFIPLDPGYKFMRWFHAKSSNILVTTPSMKQNLEKYGFDRMTIWGRGVDTEIFKPNGKTSLNPEYPTFLYAGRVAAEKNIEAFLRLDLPGRKVVVGDGPSRLALERKYPAAQFLGYKFGADLAEQYANADVFVFPSKTDTFGLVMLEAMACGTPVAAFPVPGPIDVITSGVTGILSEDLQSAALEALKLKHEDCREHALTRSWRACAQIMLKNLVPAKSKAHSKIATEPTEKHGTNC
ncbi:MAG TPA: glycosyltransferase family 1 protein [Gammaproteobacteria bacterium]